MKRIRKISQIKTSWPIAKRKPQPRTIPAREPSIELHEYDPITKFLTVAFTNGRKYRYYDVDARTAEDLAGAPSKGTFMRTSVIGKFTATKL